MSERSIAVAAKPAVQMLSPPQGGILQRKCACGQHTMGGECAECKKKNMVLQRFAAHPTVPVIPPIVNEVLQSGGRPLETATRTSMETSFKHDFSRVRVHTDERAQRSARAVNARAYTVGHDVVFAANQYIPRTAEGKKLIAHELTHVVQQRTATASSSLDLTASEVEAEKSAERVVAGQSAIINRSAPKHLARKADDDPVSLNGTFDPGIKTYDQLLEELGKIQKWLESHPQSSPDRTRLESVQTQIAETMRRIDKAMGRSSPLTVIDIRPFSKSPEQVEETAKLREKMAPPPQNLPGPSSQTAPTKTESALDKFSREHAKEIAQLPLWNEHFAQGMARSALGGKLGEAWQQLKNDLTSPGRGVRFYMGVQVGVPVGAVKDVYEQVKGVLQLMIAAFIFDMKLRADPIKVWSDLKQFANSLPDKLIKLFDADALGFAAGQALAAKVDQEFVKKDAFDQGFAIGEAIGTILMEVALLFVGVEEVSAAAKAAKAATLGEEVAHGMSLTSRELKALLEAEGALRVETKLAEGTAKEAKALGEAEDLSRPKITLPGVDETVEKEIRSLGTMDAHSDRVLRENPELRRALVENPLAADALKLCKSPCLPDFATPQQVKTLNKSLEKFQRSGIKIDTAKLKEYLHAQPDHVSLNEALDRLEESYADLTSQTKKAADERWVDDARKLEEELGIRERKPPEATMSEAREGQAFDRQRRPLYPANEVPIRDKGGVRRRLDSYDSVKGEIVSRKSLASTNGQIAMANEFTMIDYFQEFALKYPDGATIADGKLDGQVVRGKYILEVPVQEHAIPERILSEARIRYITIRDINGKIY